MHWQTTGLDHLHAHCHPDSLSQGGTDSGLHPDGSVHRIELYGRSFIRYFSELGSIFKQVLHLKTLNSRLPCFDARLER